MSTELDILLPENDPDLALARQIGLFLEKPSVSEGSPDTLGAVLQQWKKQHLTSASLLHVDSDSLWSKIDSTIEASEKHASQTSEKQLFETATVTKSTTAAPVFRIHWKMWSAVAAVLLIGFFFYSIFLVPEHYGPYATTKTITLADGSEIQLRQNSRFSLSSPLFSDDVSVELSGEARFAVAKNRNRRFTVNAGDLSVEVTGTVFYVQRAAKNAFVYLEEGAVTVTAGSTPRLTIVPGDFVTVSDSQPPVVSRKTSALEITDWLNDRLVFENAPLSTILPDLEVHFNIQFELDPTLLNELLSGELVLESELQVLNDLGQALGGRFELHGSFYRFIRN